MEDLEVPTEHLHEHIKEKAEESRERWSVYAAVSTALMAVFAAISGLLAGHYSNEALIEQIKASDQWSYYQAKGIKAEIKALQSKEGMADAAAIAKYKTEQEEIKKAAEEAEKESGFHLKKHIFLSQAVTFFQIAIAISAISILTKKKSLWIGSILISLAGMGFFIWGFI